jgi:long-chain acyl-CoA synthetase
MEIRDFRNVHEMLKETVDRFGDRTAYRSIFDSGEMDAVSWNDFYDEVRRAGKSLIALGVGKDDKVNILSYSNYRWVLTDLAAASIGSCAVGIYHSLLAKDVAHIVRHSDAVLVFAEDETQLAKLMEIRAEIPEVRKVILFSGTAPADDWVITYEEFLGLGADVADDALDQRVADVDAGDTATIVYTSGTTGIPKGAVLTHDNLTFTAQSVYYSFYSKEGDVTLLFLPLAAFLPPSTWEPLPSSRAAWTPSQKISVSPDRTGSRACRGSMKRSTPRSFPAPRPRAAWR